MTDDLIAPLTAEQLDSLRANRDVTLLSRRPWFGGETVARLLATIDALRPEPSRSSPDPDLPTAKGPVEGWRYAAALRALHAANLTWEEQPDGVRKAIADAAAFPLASRLGSSPDPDPDLDSLPRATCYRTHTQPDESRGVFGAVWLADVRRVLATRLGSSPDLTGLDPK